MQMVIDIPQEAKKDIDGWKGHFITNGYDLIDAIKNGTVLPEHGRLIDGDALLKHKTDHEYISTHLIYNAPTILEGTVKE